MQHSWHFEARNLLFTPFCSIHHSKSEYISMCLGIYVLWIFRQICAQICHCYWMRNHFSIREHSLAHPHALPQLIFCVHTYGCNVCVCLCVSLSKYVHKYACIYAFELSHALTDAISLHQWAMKIWIGFMRRMASAAHLPPKCLPPTTHVRVCVSACMCLYCPNDFYSIYKNHYEYVSRHLCVWIWK